MAINSSNGTEGEKNAMVDHAELRRRAEEIIKNAKPVPLHQVLFNHAEFYNQGALAALAQLSASGNAGLAAPVIMCRSFAIELLLKFFLVLPHPTVMKYGELRALGVDLRGHPYSSLFDRIPMQFQDSIAATFSGLSGQSSTAADFRSTLVSLGDDPFVAWRYVYEKDDNQYLNFELFNQVTDALGTSAERELKKHA
jgi:hypothetical protein